MDPVLANGQPAARLLAPDGSLIGVLALVITDGRVHAMHNQINPDKLGHLGRVAEMSAMLGAAALIRAAPTADALSAVPSAKLVPVVPDEALRGDQASRR